MIFAAKIYYVNSSFVIREQKKRKVIRSILVSFWIRRIVLRQAVCVCVSVFFVSFSFLGMRWHFI